jgi:very-short-patch-repair endonuclease
MTPRTPDGEPFRIADIDGSGLSPWSLRRRHRMLFHGVYLDRDCPLSPLVLAKAALLVVESGSYLSHHTAARLWNGVVPDSPNVHVTCRRLRTQTDGITAHRAKTGQHVVRRQGLPTTSPGQTFLDLAHVLDLVDLVVLGDSLVKARHITCDELVDLTRGRRGPYSKLARRAASLVRRGVDSAMETRLRLLIVLAGLPEPVVDHRVHRRDGSLLYRFDLYYETWRLIIEYDGKQHEQERNRRSDILRDEQFDSWRLRKVVAVADDIYGVPGQTLARICRAMREQGMTVPTLSNEWRRHFPGRGEDRTALA